MQTNEFSLLFYSSKPITLPENYKKQKLLFCKFPVPHKLNFRIYRVRHFPWATNIIQNLKILSQMVFPFENCIIKTFNWGLYQTEQILLKASKNLKWSEDLWKWITQIIFFFNLKNLSINILNYKMKVLNTKG